MLRDSSIAIGFFFELLFAGLNYLIDCVDVDLAELSSEVVVDNCVQLAQHLPEFRVKVIFDAVVRSRSQGSYLPGIFCAITDHLLPI